MRTLPGILSALLLSSVAMAAEAPAPKPIVLKAARLFDGKASAPTTPGLVVVRGNRIEAVGKGSTLPADAQVIDLGDATLLPGLMDAHTHQSGEAHDDWKQDRLDRYERAPAEVALEAVPYLQRALFAGFTTVRDLGSVDFIDVGLRNASRRGTVLGPRMLVAVSSIGATGGHCDIGGVREGLLRKDQGDGVADGPDAIRAKVRRNVKYGADVIKVCATGGVLSLAGDVDSPQLTQAELDALVDEAHALRKKTAAHAHGAEGAKRAIRAGIDSIEHGSFLDEEALQLMKKKGTYLVPTMMAKKGLQERLDRQATMPPRIVEKAKAAIAAHRKMMTRAIGLGVRIAFGTDSGVYPHGRNAEEFKLMVDAGMKPVDAIKAATSVNAQLFGVADKLGTLEAGKLADIVAVPSDPTKDIRQMEKALLVMKEGAVVRGPPAKASGPAGAMP